MGRLCGEIILEKNKQRVGYQKKGLRKEAGKERGGGLVAGLIKRQAHQEKKSENLDLFRQVLSVQQLKKSLERGKWRDERVVLGTGYQQRQPTWMLEKRGTRKKQERRSA